MAQHDRPSGELYELLDRFPGLEIDGFYSDEYTYGSLTGGDKSHYYSHEEDSPCRQLILKADSFRQLGPDSGALQELREFVSEWSSFRNLFEGNDEFDDESVSMKLIQQCAHGDQEMLEYHKAFLRSLNAPKDFILEAWDYHESAIRHEIWGDQRIPSEEVGRAEVEAFMANLRRMKEMELEEVMEDLPALNVVTLEVADSDGNNALHLAAGRGLLAQAPDEFLTLDNLLIENDAGQTPISLAHESGNLEQLPGACRDEEVLRDHPRQQYIDHLIEKGRSELAAEIVRNFPTLKVS